MVEVERLLRLPLFGDLDHHDLAFVAHHVGEVAAAPGDVLFEQGEIPYELFVIEEGTAEVAQHGRAIATIGPGDVVGEMGLLQLQRRTATVRATSALRALTVSADDLATIQTEMPEVADHLRSVIAARGAGPTG